MTKEASYQIDCACAKNLCQNFGRAMALPALPVPPGLYRSTYVYNISRYSFNFYSFLNDKNPYFASQQQWLVNELDKAESAGERVG